LKRDEGSKRRKTFVFMAFGDSLTVGYQSPTEEDEMPEPVPYTGFLKTKTEKMLTERKARGLSVEFVNRGINGELTEGMTNRFASDVLELHPDVVTILGGSNDLGWGIGPSSIARNLAEMYDESLRSEIQPVACTVPSVLGFDEAIQPRLQLNQLIREYSGALGIACVDLFSATSDPSGRLREEYSNDGLHLSPKGYEAMAEAIFSEVLAGMLLMRLGGEETSLKGAAKPAQRTS